jgi:amino acid adenylation domain-containing protein
LNHPQVESSSHESSANSGRSIRNVGSGDRYGARSEAQRSVIDTIRDVMLRTPLLIAVTDGDVEWTYESLRHRSSLVVAGLLRHGISRGSVVGMHLPRSADAIATMLGIMASGCVYLPLDPDYPRARLNFMLERADATAVISQHNDPDLYGTHRLWLPAPSQTSEAEAREMAQAASSLGVEYLNPEDRAYILFTSGSTGEPKGVEVNHRSLTLMTQWSARLLDVNSADSSATATSLNFDACFHELLVPLSVGGTVHVISHALGLGQLNRPVSFAACTPTLANELLQAGLLPNLKTLMVGGEMLASDVASGLLASGRIGRLLNCYGPTECTVCVNVQEVTDPVPPIIPIGREVPSAKVVVLDEAGHRVADGVIGELCISGGQVADGYVNDPVGTAERFRVHVDPAIGPRRYYHTGDLGYRLEGGVFYFVGRGDRQVKINGCRIELGEVDAVLRSHPQIAEATSVVSDSEKLVAYVVPARPGVDVSEVRRYLCERLPLFMVPTGIVVLDELPKTVSGKLDESALPVWTPSRAGEKDLSIDVFTAQVARAVAQVTGFVGQIRPTDDFINDLGGSSLDIVRVLAQIERESGKRLRLGDALTDTSVAGWAGLLRGDPVESPADFAFNIEGHAPPLFLVHAYIGGMLRLRRLAELLPSEQPVYGIHMRFTEEQAGSVQTISAFARDALDRIREIQPTGQITVAGHSAGGLIALEIARCLLGTNEPEPRVLLIDTVRPRSSFSYYWAEFLLYFPELLDIPPAEYVSRLSEAWRRRRNRQSPVNDDDLLGRVEKDEVFTGKVVRSHRAQMYLRGITVMRTRQGRLMGFCRSDLGWSSVVSGEVSQVYIPGGHMSAFEFPHVRSMAQKVAEWLRAESSAPTH